MKKILLSLSVIVAVGAVVAGATGAFFSDTETSTGNTFTAGAIDLGIDNTSYYNGVANPETSWLLTYDLEDGQGNNASGTYLYFDFDDLKPGDYGEDTISLHVTSNDSWVCADVTLTSDDDNTCTEPEHDVEGANCDPQTEPDGDITDGDLADRVNFIWWADDGDNVLEEGEQVLPAGPLGALSVGQTATVAIADSDENIFGTPGDPLASQDQQGVDIIRYVGKAWCYGNITPEPDDQDGVGNAKSPDGDNAGTGTDLNDPDTNSGDPIDGGYLCDGSQEGNEGQTDSLTADISFRAEQSRNNGSFQCQLLQ